MDADKEGFLRNERSLIQTIGRAARNSNGHVILYADRVTANMKKAMDETARRRTVQERYNAEHGITPTTIVRAIESPLAALVSSDYVDVPKTRGERTGQAGGLAKGPPEPVTPEEIPGRLRELRAKMKAAAAELQFEDAAVLRDRIRALERWSAGL